MTELEKKLFFSNELALQNPGYLQAKRNIEEAFEKHKQEYKDLTGNDYITKLK